MKKLLMTALILMLAALLAADSEPFFQEVDARGLSVVSVENVNGDIQVTSWDRELVQINAVITGSDEDRKSIEVKVAVSEDRVDISTEHGKRYFLGLIPLRTGGRVDYDIKVPPRLHLDVESVNGEISVDGLQGDVDFSTVNGSLRGAAIGGTVDAESVNGSITLQLTSARPSCKVETINGSVEITIPGHASCHYTFETINGKIHFAQKDIEIRGSGPKDVAGTLGGGAGRIDVEVINGSITVEFDGSND